MRAKLKFFNLEQEDLEESQARIQKKVLNKGPRFASRGAKPGQEQDQFEEMMAIEAEFGSLFATAEEMKAEDVKENSVWYSLFQTIAKKKKKPLYDKLLTCINKKKESDQKT